MAPTKPLISLLLLTILSNSHAFNFAQEMETTYGPGRSKTSENGTVLTLSLDYAAGPTMRTKADYLFGRFDIQIKLPKGNAAGTVTTFYLSSDGDKHDELDMEFLGNATGQPYTLHTNVFTQGKGNREQQFRLWFDPSADFHTYSFVWNLQRVIFLVDNIPIRVFANMETLGVPYLNQQAMNMYVSIWNGEEWATQGGRVKTDWTLAPFVASYRYFSVNQCTAAGGCAGQSSGWVSQAVDSVGVNQIKWAQRNLQIYNYCSDYKRFPNGFPPECSSPMM